MVTGKTLIELGYTPSEWFGTALRLLKYVSEHDLDEIRSICDELVKSNVDNKLYSFKSNIDYKLFIDANSAVEKQNLDLVIRDMNEIMKTPTVIDGAIMPDGCPVGQGNIPVGAVCVTENTIHPLMHSSDVCCSVATTILPPETNMKTLMDDCFNFTHFGKGGRRDAIELNSDLEVKIKSNYFTRDFIELSKSNLGTQGDGNHFLFIGRSEKTNNVHLVTHHGSRGFGAKVYKKGINEARRFTEKICKDTKNYWLDYNTDLGKEYWEALQIVKEWTLLNHKVIHSVAKKYSPIDFYWNPHNFVFKDGNKFYHAKGSTPMLDKFNTTKDERNTKLIPLNMAEPILIVESIDDNVFGFAPHGAGRNMSRTEFNKQYSKDELTKSVSHLDVRFYSGIPDTSEFPQAYKSANEVTKQIEKFKLAKIVDKILPYGSIMAGGLT